MTRRELNLAIFEGTAQAVLWQPRLETWYYKLKEQDRLPARFRDLDYWQFYDKLGCSIRYAASRGLHVTEDPDEVERTTEQQGNEYHVIVRTPLGELRTVYRDIWEGNRLRNRRIMKFPVTTPQDLRVLTHIVEHTRYQATPKRFQRAADELGVRGEPTQFLASSGFTDLIKHHAGLVQTYYLLTDYPREVEAYLEACDRRDDRMLDEALKLPCKLFNLGDHATNEFTPPPILKKYLIPRWQKIARRLGEAGRYVHSHWDGHSRLMLPYLRETGLHGVEALTPAPMGDMTLEEIKAAVGQGRDQMVVLDLIPAILFLESYSVQEVVDFARRVIDLFAPRLILGISDEISEAGQIEKVEAVSELVDRVCGLAA